MIILIIMIMAMMVVIMIMIVIDYHDDNNGSYNITQLFHQEICSSAHSYLILNVALNSVPSS